VLRDRFAGGILGAIAQHDNTRCVINAAIGGFVSMPDNPELTDALSDNNADIPPEPRQIHSTFRWLMEQVAPAMARYQQEHPEGDVLAALEAVYRAELGRRATTDEEPDNERK